MFHNLGLPDGQTCFEGSRTPFEEYCARADECQRLADRYPSIKQQYEDLARQWLELSRHGERCAPRWTALRVCGRQDTVCFVSIRGWTAAGSPACGPEDDRR
jgi:hypothetical protein